MSCVVHFKVYCILPCTLRRSKLYEEKKNICVRFWVFTSFFFKLIWWHEIFYLWQKYTDKNMWIKCNITNCGRMMNIYKYIYIDVYTNVYYFVGRTNIPTAASNLLCDCFISLSQQSQVIPRWCSKKIRNGKVLFFRYELSTHSQCYLKIKKVIHLQSIFGSNFLQWFWFIVPVSMLHSHSEKNAFVNLNYRNTVWATVCSGFFVSYYWKKKKTLKMFWPVIFPDDNKLCKPRPHYQEKSVVENFFWIIFFQFIYLYKND